MDDIRVLLLIPSGGAAIDGLNKWLWHTVHNAPFPIEWDYHYGRPIDEARNSAVHRYLTAPKPFSHLWQIDDDNIPPPNAYEMVMANKSIISGVVYIWRDGAPLALIMEWDEEAQGFRQDTDIIQRINDGERLVKIKPGGAAGTGCFVVKREVYENLVGNWFRYQFDDSGRTTMGQDFHFYRRCNEIGYSVWLDGNVHVGHMKNLNILDVQKLLMEHERRIRREYDEDNKG
jgi:hypothetical protein